MFFENKLKNILVTGPLAVDKAVYSSHYDPQNTRIRSVLEGIQNYVSIPAKVDFSFGCEVVDEVWPEGKIILFPLTRDEKNGIDVACTKAKKSELISTVMGEDGQHCGESRSRTNLGLLGSQFQLLQVLKRDRQTNHSNSNQQKTIINWENQYIQAILEAWSPNVEGSNAISKTILGDYNPGGKLPITFPRSVGLLELNFSYKPSSQLGQPSSEPNGTGKTSVVGELYPFGYGLSYTQFEYQNLNIFPETGRTQQQVQVSIEAINAGKVKRDAVVQLYFNDLVSSVNVYQLQLSRFECITLDRGRD
ncbi:glycoside hydrolase family 3 C-terminal domain-containing protein [Flagellimonas marina]|uniref:Glycoside hydrolase family 3 C-terminal domain-containing protein n=1 Tax=Flagellimonas marina TaxID=1775168 RepID=A0ABV8PPH9_9FLAO